MVQISWKEPEKKGSESAEIQVIQADGTSAAL